MEYGTVDEELHYFRLKLNRTPSSFEELVNNKENWYIYTKENTRYHMNNCRYNESDFNNLKIDYNTYKEYGRMKKSLKVIIQENIQVTLPMATNTT